MSAGDKTNKVQFHQMSSDEYEAAAGEGRRWVYHASESPDTFSEGVKMENVPQHAVRQRYAAGEPTTFAPGAGVGQGTYVTANAYDASGYGHFMHAFSVPTEHIEVPPESMDYKPDDVEYHLGRAGTGGLLTRDVPPDRVVNLGRIKDSVSTGHELHQLNAIRAGESVPEEHIGERLKSRLQMAKERGWDI